MYMTDHKSTWTNFLVYLKATLYAWISLRKISYSIWRPPYMHEYPSYAYSMATFSMVPYLTIVSTHGSVITPLDMQETNCTQCNGWQDRRLASPIVHVRTNIIVEVMKAIDIPHHDCSCDYSWYEHCGSREIFTNLQVSYYSEWSTRIWWALMQ
jgi:hypothetical protein